MSKALVIKGASFFANRIEQIDISDPIECTGISISRDAVTFTSIGATANLSATVTPADTTEAITWASSDTDVATVDDGVVTCTGIGTATITVSCGTQSAECEVTATSVHNANSEYNALSKNELSSTNLGTGKDYVSYYTQSRARIYGDDTAVENGWQLFMVNGSSSLYNQYFPIIIPDNTETITIDFPTGFSLCYYVFCDALSRETYNASYVSVKALTNIINSGASNGRAVISIPSDISAQKLGFAFQLKTPSASEDTVTGDVTVTFS